MRWLVLVGAVATCAACSGGTTGGATGGATTGSGATVSGSASGGATSGSGTTGSGSATGSATSGGSTTGGGSSAGASSSGGGTTGGGTTTSGSTTGCGFGGGTTGGASEPGCTRPNCETLLNCNAWVFPTIPCGSLPRGCETQAMIDDLTMQACVDVCNIGGNGTFMQCVADNFRGSTCTGISLDGGDPFFTIVATCDGDAGPPCGVNCAACQIQCGKDNYTCNVPCLDAGTLGACVSCNSDCGEQWAQCIAACPSD